METRHSEWRTSTISLHFSIDIEEILKLSLNILYLAKINHEKTFNLSVYPILPDKDGSLKKSWIPAKKDNVPLRYIFQLPIKMQFEYEELH
jgi:hypothetical protein